MVYHVVTLILTNQKEKSKKETVHFMPILANLLILGLYSKKKIKYQNLLLNPIYKFAN